MPRPSWMPQPLDERILDNVTEVQPKGCWMWALSLNPNGYGRIRVGYRDRLVHRVSYETFVGPIPEGMEIDHRCNVTACCRPDHLEPVTHAENMRRAAERRWRKMMREYA